MTEERMETLEREFIKLKKQFESSNEKIDKIYEYLLGDGKFEKDGAKAKVDVIWSELPEYREMKPVLKSIVDERNDKGYKEKQEILDEIVNEKRSKRFFRKYASEINFFMTMVNGAIALYLIVIANFFSRG